MNLVQFLPRVMQKGEVRIVEKWCMLLVRDTCSIDLPIGKQRSFSLAQISLPRALINARSILQFHLVVVSETSRSRSFDSVLNAYQSGTVARLLSFIILQLQIYSEINTPHVFLCVFVGVRFDVVYYTTS